MRMRMDGTVQRCRMLVAERKGWRCWWAGSCSDTGVIRGRVRYMMWRITVVGVLPAGPSFRSRLRWIKMNGGTEERKKDIKKEINFRDIVIRRSLSSVKKF